MEVDLDGDLVQPRLLQLGKGIELALRWLEARGRKAWLQACAGILGKGAGMANRRDDR